MDQTSPTLTKEARRTRFLHLLGQPGCLVHYSLIQVMVYIFIGRTPPFYFRIYGAYAPKPFIAFVDFTVFKLTRHVHVTLRRSYVHLGHTTVNMDSYGRYCVDLLPAPMTSNNSEP